MARNSERVRSSGDCDIRAPPYRAQSCRRPTMQTLANQPDNFVPAMMVAVMVLAEVTAENSGSYGYLYEDAQDAFSCRLRCLGPPQRLGNCAELLGTRLDGQYAVGMSEATPPPTPSAEQLAEWRGPGGCPGPGGPPPAVAWGGGAGGG